MSHIAAGIVSTGFGARTIAKGAPPTSEGVHEPEILALAPSIYLKFGGDLSDSSGAGRGGTLVGSGGSFVAAITPNVGAGNTAFDTEGTASVSIAHLATSDTALSIPSDWEALATASPGTASIDLLDGFRFIADTTISCDFKINAMPTGSDKAVIFAKSHADAPGTANSYAESAPIQAVRGDTVNGGSFAAYFDANGAVHVDMRSFRGRPCLIRTPDGAVTTNTRYHLTVQLSYDGVTAWLDGAKFEDGYANLMHVYGLCANIRGVVFRNSYAWTIGAAAWGGQSDIIVDEFSVFNRAPSATISQANVNTLSQQGSTPAALAHYIWGAVTVNENTYSGSGATRINNAINDVNASGGGTVLINPGTYSGDVVLKSNVRIKANSGTVTINGTCTTPTLSPSTFSGVGTGTLATGGRTLSITNSAVAGQLVKIKGASVSDTPLRHDRRWNSLSESNGQNIPDGQSFQVESATGSVITFTGSGSVYDFTQANRDSVTLVTPTKWIAVEGDIRFSATENTVEIIRTIGGRFVGCRATSTSTGLSETFQITQDCMFIQARGLTVTQATVGSGSAANDGLCIYQGSADCVYKDCDVFEGRHGGDFSGNPNFGTSIRGEWHNINWTNDNSRAAGGTMTAYGAHGSCTDGIYWCCDSNFGGPAATGWKHCSRWGICGDPNESGSGCIHMNDGAEGSAYRDLHIIRPRRWFHVSEGATGVERCHFENITRTAAPTDSAVHQNRYGSGAEVNTYTNVDAPWTTGATAWQQV